MPHHALPLPLLLLLLLPSLLQLQAQHAPAALFTTLEAEDADCGGRLLGPSFATYVDPPQLAAEASGRRACQLMAGQTLAFSVPAGQTVPAAATLPHAPPPPPPRASRTASSSTGHRAPTTCTEETLEEIVLHWRGPICLLCACPIALSPVRAARLRSELRAGFLGVQRACAALLHPGRAWGRRPECHSGAPCKHQPPSLHSLAWCTAVRFN